MRIKDSWIYYSVLLVTLASEASRSCSPSLKHPQRLHPNEIAHSLDTANPQTCLSSPISLSEPAASDRQDEHSEALSPLPYRRRGIFGDLPATPIKIQRQISTGICDQPIMEIEESSECLSENDDVDVKAQQLTSSRKETRTVVFRLRRRQDLKEVTMVASWSGWREHSVLFHRNRFGYDSDEGRFDDDHSTACVEVNLPNGTHHFKVQNVLNIWGSFLSVPTFSLTKLFCGCWPVPGGWTLGC